MDIRSTTVHHHHHHQDHHHPQQRRREHGSQSNNTLVKGSLACLGGITRSREPPALNEPSPLRQRRLAAAPPVGRVKDGRGSGGGRATTA